MSYTVYRPVAYLNGIHTNILDIYFLMIYSVFRLNDFDFKVLQYS